MSPDPAEASPRSPPPPAWERGTAGADQCNAGIRAIEACQYYQPETGSVRAHGSGNPYGTLARNAVPVRALRSPARNCCQHLPLSQRQALSRWIPRQFQPHRHSVLAISRTTSGVAGTPESRRPRWNHPRSAASLAKSRRTPSHGSSNLSDEPPRIPGKKISLRATGSRCLQAVPRRAGHRHVRPPKRWGEPRGWSRRRSTQGAAGRPWSKTGGLP